MALFPYPAQVGLIETFTFGSQILRGRSGTEQRIAKTCGVPRWEFDATYSLSADRMRAAEALWHAGGQDAWSLPVWTESVEHFGPLAATETEIVCDTRYGRFVEGSDVTIWSSPEHCETATLDAVTDGSLTLSAGLASSYSGRVLIVPTFTAWATLTSSWSHRRTGAGSVALAWTLTDNPRPSDLADPLVTYDDIEVLAEPWPLAAASQWSVETTPQLTMIDNGIGRLAAAAAADYAQTNQPYHRTLRGPKEAWDFKQWLHRLAGRQKSFFVPTWKRDFVPSTAAGASDDTLDVVAAGRVGNYGPDDLRQYVGIWLDGTLTVRKITDLTAVSATVERLALDTTLGRAVPAGDRARICWVDRCRLAKDAVSLQWPVRHRAQVATALTRIWQTPVAYGDGVYGMGVLAG